MQFRSADPNINIRLNNWMAPQGTQFSGTLLRAPDPHSGGKTSQQNVRLSLQCETEGTGERASILVWSDTYVLDQFGQLSTQFVMPVGYEQPISYDGRLIRVVWKIEARVDKRYRIDTVNTAPVVVIPDNGWGIYDRPHPLPMQG